MPEVFILTGDIQSGKTTALLRWCEQKDVRGILTPVIDGKRVFMKAGSKEIFRMEANDDEEALPVGKYRFSRCGFEKANQLLNDSIEKKEWLIVDEIGPLELRGEGFAEVVRNILAWRKAKTVFVVRKSLLNNIISHFTMENTSVTVVENVNELPA